MGDRPDKPRIPPLPAAEWTEEQQALLEPPNPPLNIFTTLVRHPRLLMRWLPFARKLLFGGRLSARDRELVILRVAWRCRCAYEWGQHVAIARDAGITDEEIGRVATAGPEGPGWPSAEAVLLRAVDELIDDHCITDPTWTALTGVYDEEQLIELPMLAGQYAMLAGGLNSFGVQPEGDLPPLGTT